MGAARNYPAREGFGGVPSAAVVERRSSIELVPDAVNLPVMPTSGSSASPSPETLVPRHSVTLTPGRPMIAPKFGASFSSQQDRRLAGRMTAAASGWKPQPMLHARHNHSRGFGSVVPRALGRCSRSLLRAPAVLHDPKYIAVALLVAHSVLAPLMIRVSRLQAVQEGPGGGYLTSVAVFLGEVMKFICSLGISFHESGMSQSKWRDELWDSIVSRPRETAGVALVSLLYSLQNVLIYLALTYINAATFQVTYQMRILLTAVLSYVMLRRRISLNRWLCVSLLSVGVALVELPTEWSGRKSATSEAVTTRLLKAAEDPIEHRPAGALFRLVLVLLPCLTSAFSGVFFERLLKQSPVSIWLRNVQLAFYGMGFALIFILRDWMVVKEHGLLHGFGGLVWATVAVQALGGLIIAAVLKYADNIVKCFGNATGLVLSVLTSSCLLGDVPISIPYLVGTGIVVFSTYAYGVDLPLISDRLANATAFERLPSLNFQDSEGPLQEDSKHNNIELQQ